MFVCVQLKESVEDLIIGFFDLLKNVEVFDIVYLKQRKKFMKFIRIILVFYVVLFCI